MDLDRLKGAWQSQETGGRAPQGGSDPLKPVMERLDALDRDVQRRDFREYLAACFSIAFFGWQAAIANDPWVRAGALIVVFGSMFIILWSRRATLPARRQRFTSDLPMVQFCARELERVNAQVRLLESVWWWYVTPTIVGVLIMTLAKPQPLALRLAVAALILGVGLAIHWMNVTTARTHLYPLRDDVERALRALGNAEC